MQTSRPLCICSRANHSSSSRTLTVTKDEDGYGLTLSGDNPVFVQTVKPGGAADRAGVQKGDIIVRVNGQTATKMCHTEVVHLIQGKFSSYHK
jgi:Rho guanine nucleotide exchange factor 12